MPEMMDIKEKRSLIIEARRAREASYSPYSHFSVGAAVLCDNGKIYRGCNIENAAYSPTCCAERVALFSAVADGERDFRAIAIVGDSAPCYPCGVCRQVMAELCREDTEIILEKGDGEPDSLKLSELLPYAFKLEKN